MNRPLLSKRPLVIGMLHAPPLPDAPAFAGSLDDVMSFVVNDAESLERGGVHALMLENFGDHPLYPRSVPPVTVAAMTKLAVAVRQAVGLPLGMNMLRNDGISALAVAAAAGAGFIRVNVLCGARVTDQGLLEGIAHDLMRARSGWRAHDVAVFADVDVKHSAAIGEIDVEQQTSDLLHRGGADAVIVSGAGTGRKVDVDKLRRVKSAAGEHPVLVGSGVTAKNVCDLLAYADGVIVGTSLKRDGDVSKPVDVDRVRALMSAVR